MSRFSTLVCTPVMGTTCYITLHTASVREIEDIHCIFVTTGHDVKTWERQVMLFLNIRMLYCSLFYGYSFSPRFDKNIRRASQAHVHRSDLRNIIITFKLSAHFSMWAQHLADQICLSIRRAFPPVGQETTSSYFSLSRINSTLYGQASWSRHEAFG
jgi:hypothetical protein